MCQYMIQITPSVQERAIYRCEHGVFHLAWDSALIHLAPESLTYLISLIVRCDSTQKAQPDQHIQLIPRRTPEGEATYELWIDECALRLTTADYHGLRQLLWDVNHWLAHQPRFSAQQHLRMANWLNLEPRPADAEFYLN